MRILLLSSLLLVLGSFYIRETQKPFLPVMCHDPNGPIEQFAAFADDPLFRAAHPAPLPTGTVHQGEMVEFAVEGGDKGHAYLAKAEKPTDKYLLVFQEWWGLNDYIKNEADMWGRELGVNVLAIDLYDGKVATTPDEAGKLMKACDPKRASAIIEAAAKYAGDKATFRTIGWCFGGGFYITIAQISILKLKKHRG